MNQKSSRVILTEIGEDKVGIIANVPAVLAEAQMGRIVLETEQLPAAQDWLGCAKFVVFCNAVEENPFMADAFHCIGEPELYHQRWRHRPGVVPTP